MPNRALTDEENRDNRIRRQINNFMKNVKGFLSSKSGDVNPEWECSLIMLETYYKQFLMLTWEIDRLPSLVVDTRYGKQPNALLTARDKSAVRLESMMKQLGITFKEAARLDIIEPVNEESDLEKWVKAKINKEN
jgi:hypothetical protein